MKDIQFGPNDPRDFFGVNTNTNADYMRTYLDLHYKEYFLYKSEEWMSEHEFRWLVCNANLSEEMYVPIDTALKAVIVGAKGDVYIPSVTALCKSLGVRVFAIKWFNGKPRVHSIPLP